MISCYVSPRNKPLFITCSLSQSFKILFSSLLKVTIHCSAFSSLSDMSCQTLQFMWVTCTNSLTIYYIFQPINLHLIATTNNWSWNKAWSEMKHTTLWCYRYNSFCNIWKSSKVLIIWSIWAAFGQYICWGMS